MPMLNYLASAAKDARQAANKKRSHCAAAADVDQSAITRFENASAWPLHPDRMVEAYAEVLKIPAAAIWADALRLWITNETGATGAPAEWLAATPGGGPLPADREASLRRVLEQLRQEDDGADSNPGATSPRRR